MRIAARCCFTVGFEALASSQGLDIGQPADPMLDEPGEERTGCPVVGHPRIVVVDRSGEEFQKAARSAFTGVSDHRRHRD
jgi:hypothetical protein